MDLDNAVKKSQMIFTNFFNLINIILINLFIDKAIKIL